MRKLLFLSVIVIAGIFIISGLLTTDGHILQDKAQEIAEDLTSQTVTYVGTYEYRDDKMKVFVFADPQGREFAIVSKMEQSAWLAEASIGPYNRCAIYENYIGGMMVSHLEEIKSILARYELLEYTDFFENIHPEYIHLGKMLNSPRIYIKLTAGDANYNLEMLQKVAAAGAEIDALLSLSYDEKYPAKAHESDIYMTTYSNYHGIQVNFSVNQIDVNGQVYKKSDIAHFNYSTSGDTRWSEETLLKHLYEQYSILELAPLPKH